MVRHVILRHEYHLLLRPGSHGVHSNSLETVGDVPRFQTRLHVVLSNIHGVVLVRLHLFEIPHNFPELFLVLRRQLFREPLRVVCFLPPFTNCLFLRVHIPTLVLLFTSLELSYPLVFFCVPTALLFAVAVVFIVGVLVVILLPLLSAFLCQVPQRHGKRNARERRRVCVLQQCVNHVRTFPSSATVDYYSCCLFEGRGCVFESKMDMRG
mmetsp:Transcript_5187/g.11582  ORF Transcript_5187/g.11582 Transcript_5187/m.11582 type:complete len:210 (-) Transcript_5187:199-828(-)